MSVIVWDQVGQKYYETGTDHGVLYLQDSSGAYPEGVAWNGLTGVTESPSGAEANKLYADNILYANLRSAEEFGGTITAFTYPDEWEACNGEAEIIAGAVIGQQARKAFGLCYRTRIGNDISEDAGYKLHLVYGATVSPSERAYTTVNDSPEGIEFSWEFETTPVPVPSIDGTSFRPTSVITIDSRKYADTAGKAKLAALEAALYGTQNADPYLPLPGQVYKLLVGEASV